MYAIRSYYAIDEHRTDFEPTIWIPKENLDIKQVWFAGAHSDIGGSYKPDKDGLILSDNSLNWIVKEAIKFGLSIEEHLVKSINTDSSYNFV